MEKSALDRVPTEIIEYIAEHLGRADVSSFRLTCKQNNRRVFRAFARRFFSTYKTSLVGTGLERLTEIAAHVGFRDYVKVIDIEDDSANIDPWNGLDRASINARQESAEIWPRDATGTIATAEIGAQALRAMLLYGHLRPETLRIRDYRISNDNLELCSETIRRRLCYRAGPNLPWNSEPAAALAKDILVGADVAITSFVMRYDSKPSGEGRVSVTLDNNSRPEYESLSSPHATVITIGLLPLYQGRGVGCSLLRSAEIVRSQYWRDQAIGSSLRLESLTLQSLPVPANPTTATTMLKQLALKSITLDARAVLALLANSTGNLRDVRFTQVTLQHGLGWSELLDTIGHRCPGLTSFAVIIPREYATSDPASCWAITFLGFQKSHVPEESRAGLELIEKGVPGNMRLTKVRYQGPNAGVILQRLAQYAHRRAT